jgi:segregation and condensation protein B
LAEVVRRFLRLERGSRLSGAALETLALTAYREPVTRAEIEAMRGVDCTGVLPTLHARGLIEIAGKLPTAGNPNQCVTTLEFLRQFGLNSLADLPPRDSPTPGEPERLFDEFTLPPQTSVQAGGERLNETESPASERSGA